MTKVTQTLSGAILDMTEYKLTGERLKEQILKDAKSTVSSFFGINRPDKLYVRKDQFKSIEKDTQRMEDTKDRLYYLPGVCVMEVKVME